jgi:DNA-binding GntR family transcriptional regulator
MHRRIYQAIRARDPETARRAMNDHLIQASRHQAQEPATDGTPRRNAAVSVVEPKRRPRIRRRQTSN